MLETVFGPCQRVETREHHSDRLFRAQTGSLWFIRGEHRKDWQGVDPFDVRLEDDELLDEVELTSNLIVAANQSDRPLSPAEIDRILGLSPGPPRHRSA